MPARYDTFIAFSVAFLSAPNDAEVPGAPPEPPAQAGLFFIDLEKVYWADSNSRPAHSMRRIGQNVYRMRSKVSRRRLGAEPGEAIGLLPLPVTIACFASRGPGRLPARTGDAGGRWRPNQFSTALRARRYGYVPSLRSSKHIG